MIYISAAEIMCVSTEITEPHVCFKESGFYFGVNVSLIC